MKRFTYRSRWELTIALTLFFVLCYAAFCDMSQQALSEDVLRLRVVADSDEAVDQIGRASCRERV